VSGSVPMLVAVNTDPAESDPGRMSVEDFKSAVTPLGRTGQSSIALQGQEQEDRQHIWQYVLAVMVMALVAESLVSTRVA
jgi:hypothetical protein